MANIVTVRDALRAARARADSADAQALLGAALGVDRAYLLSHPERPLTEDQAEQYRSELNRLEAGEPLAYILRRRAFYDRELIVTPDVLIPRPETELLLEEALAFARRHPGLTAVDVGTGSGALAVTLAARMPSARVYATDVSPAALDVAQQNAALHSANVTFLPGDLLQPFIEQDMRLDLLMANLPYIASGDLPDLDVSRYEPRLALDGGADGLDLIRRLLAQAPGLCNPGALALLEIGAEQGAAALALARQAFPQAHADVMRDYAGHDRIIRIRDIQAASQA